MFFQQLEDAARMLQSGIGFGIALFVQLIEPTFFVVKAAFGVVGRMVFAAGEHTFVEIKTVADDKRCVGVGLNVFPLDFVVLNQPVD